jgi:hypothetical protein
MRSADAVPHDVGDSGLLGFLFSCPSLFRERCAGIDGEKAHAHGEGQHRSARRHEAQKRTPIEPEGSNGTHRLRS